MLQLAIYGSFVLLWEATSTAALRELGGTLAAAAAKKLPAAEADAMLLSKSSEHSLCLAPAGWASKPCWAAAAAPNRESQGACRRFSLARLAACLFAPCCSCPAPPFCFAGAGPPFGAAAAPRRPFLLGLQRPGGGRRLG